jgi:glycerol-3-phosphate acyltransferase PlsY
MAHYKEIVVVIVSYMLGCVSTGYYLTKFLAGKDIRNLGSRSTGATNVGRILGKRGFLITLSGDFLKGMVAMSIAVVLQLEPWAVQASLLSVVIGHVWPVQLGFHGGKGVAAAFGALLIFDYFLAVGCLAVFAMFFFLLRKYTVSGLLGIFALPLLAVLLRKPLVDIVGLTILVILILFAHRTNILRSIQSSNISTEPGNQQKGEIR